MSDKQVIIDRVRAKYRDSMEIAIANLSNIAYPYEQALTEINSLRHVMELEVARELEAKRHIITVDPNQDGLIQMTMHNIGNTDLATWLESLPRREGYKVFENKHAVLTLENMYDGNLVAEYKDGEWVLNND